MYYVVGIVEPQIPVGGVASSVIVKGLEHDQEALIFIWK